MSELQVVEPAAEVLVPLTRDAAEKLDGRIRRLAKQAGDQLVQVGRLLDEAQAGLVHEALGFASWTAYVADALGGTLSLSGEARQAMVQLMAGEGMSERAIADATGASKTTVHRDLEEVVHNGPPEPDPEVVHHGPPESDTAAGPPEPATVTGLDGKTYTKPKPKPKGKGDKDAPRRPDACKTIERIAPRLEGFATVVSELDPAQVDGQEMAAELATLAESLDTIQKFVNGVSVPESSGRRVQIPTMFRAKVADLAPVIAGLEELAKDPRWPKAVDRFKPTDRINVGKAIFRLQKLHEELGGPPAPDPFDDVDVDAGAHAAHRTREPAAEADSPESTDADQVLAEVASDVGQALGRLVGGSDE